MVLQIYENARASDFILYDEGTSFNPHPKAAILEVVENQFRESDSPETRQTLERLLAAGYSRKQATEMIGSAVMEEIWAVLYDHKPFIRISGSFFQKFLAKPKTLSRMILDKGGQFL
jgi:hypothetical protein